MNSEVYSARAFNRNDVLELSSLAFGKCIMHAQRNPKLERHSLVSSLPSNSKLWTSQQVSPLPQFNVILNIQPFMSEPASI